MTLNTKNMTIMQFLQLARNSQDSKELELTEMSMHRTFFAMLWRQCDTSLTHVYKSMGHLAEVIVGETYSKLAGVKRLKTKTLAGKIRSTNDVIDDVEFICLTVDDEIILLLNTQAKGHGLASVQYYDTEAEMFDSIGKDLPSFVCSNDISIVKGPSAEKSKDAKAKAVVLKKKPVPVN